MMINDLSNTDFAEIMADFGNYSAEALAIALDFEKINFDGEEVDSLEYFDFYLWREMTFDEALNEAEAFKIISRQDFDEIAKDEGEAVAVKTCTSLMLEGFDQCGPVYTLKNGSILWKPVV